MKRMSRSYGLGVLAFAVVFGSVSAASAQTLVGNWGPIMHEDQLERAAVRRSVTTQGSRCPKRDACGPRRGTPRSSRC